MPKCTINGKEIEVKTGSTIIEAMFQENEAIAHYCYHPGLSVAGVCRLCMVEIEGNPRVQIACNTAVTEGMKINNTSDKVKDAVKWGLDFHLINHPLDCPICDQAGECGLQEQYMAFGQYDSEMAEHKQKKHKVVDLGPKVVLDSERCILCSRCVRFTDEISKTNELGIFNRGDRSEIGTIEGKQLDNNYSLNTVDICPVGALTSKDFRFRQRVWYLKDADTICTGCSTGCNIKVYFNKEGFFRTKPRFNADVNSYWMCDNGRDIYKFLNKLNRNTKGIKYSNGQQTEITPGAAARDAAKFLKQNSNGGIGVVLTGQYTNEEYDSLISVFINEFKTKKIFHWINGKDTFEDFDGFLIRGDKNPNTKGLLSNLEKYNILGSWQDLQNSLFKGELKTLIILGPENLSAFPDFSEKFSFFSKAENLVWCQSAKSEDLDKLGDVKGTSWLIPLKTFVEKSGTFINATGKAQIFKKATTIISEALSGTDLANIFSGKAPLIQTEDEVMINILGRTDQVKLEHRKKNEFVFKRGTI